MNTDPKVILIIVIALAVIVLCAMAGTFALIEQKADAAQIALLSGMGGTALGGLLSMLNNTRSGNGSTPVSVTNPPSDPVPTTETK